MKKTIFIFFALGVLVVSQSKSQPLSIGLKGGLNLASVSGDLTGTENRVGFHAGILAKLQITSSYALQPELIYSSQGWGSETTDDKVNVNYLLIPVLGNFYLFEGLSLNVGPQIGFLLGTDNIDSDDIKGSDLAVALGVTYEFPVVPLLFSGRYNMGLNNINDQEDSAEISNQVFQFSLGYKFL